MRTISTTKAAITSPSGDCDLIALPRNLARRSAAFFDFA
jgi:hypothetical protein